MTLRPLFAFVVTLLLGACATGNAPQRLERATRDECSLAPVSVELALPDQPSAAEQLAAAEAAPVPSGVDPALFAELRATLAATIGNRGEPPRLVEPGPPAAGPSKTTSFTPYGWVNRIDDLVLSGTGPYRLSWTYRNKGDYDLNGMVNVSDLTPIGVFYGMSHSEPRWLFGTAADGDGNGMVTISDITPIGQYFGGTIIGYQVWGTNDPADQWSHVGNATVETNLNKNPLRPRFVVELPSLDYTYYSIWPYDNSEDEGWWSNITALDTAPRRHIIDMEKPW